MTPRLIFLVVVISRGSSQQGNLFYLLIGKEPLVYLRYDLLDPLGNRFFRLGGSNFVLKGVHVGVDKGLYPFGFYFLIGDKTPNKNLIDFVEELELVLYLLGVHHFYPPR